MLFSSSQQQPPTQCLPTGYFCLTSTHTLPSNGDDNLQRTPLEPSAWRPGVCSTREAERGLLVDPRLLLTAQCGGVSQTTLIAPDALAVALRG